MGIRRVELGLTCKAPIAQLAEAADLKSAKCRFESDWGHQNSAQKCAVRKLAEHHQTALLGRRAHILPTVSSNLSATPVRSSSNKSAYTSNVIAADECPSIL